MKTFCFFSVHGGVGRTSLLESIAAKKAAAGSVVVMIDMDFISSGLTLSKKAGGWPFLPPEERGSSFGMSDVFAAFQLGLKEGVVSVLDTSTLLREYARDDYTKAYSQVKNGRIYLIDSGTAYGRAIGSILSEIEPSKYVTNLAESFLEELKKVQTPEGKPIDYVFINVTANVSLVPLEFAFAMSDHVVFVTGMDHVSHERLEYGFEQIPAKFIPDEVTVVASRCISCLPHLEMLADIERKAKRLKKLKSDYPCYVTRQIYDYSTFYSGGKSFYLLDFPESRYASDIYELMKSLELV